MEYCTTTIVKLAKHCMEKYGLFKTALVIVLFIIAWQSPDIITAVRWW
ncbi:MULTISPECIES: hypothetical protein [unclassified Moraxella]